MQHKKISAIKKIAIITIVCLPLLALTVGKYSRGISAEPQDTYKSLEVFSNILSIIQQNYVEEVDTQQLMDGAIKGMLETLDPHSSYLKPDHFKELQVETKGSFSGIGIEITIKDNMLTVVSPIEGTPAFKQGLKAGDKIIKIENESTVDLSLMEAVKKLRGRKGSKVNITVHRKGWTEPKKFTIVRDVIPLQSVKSKIIEPGYGYIRITNFQANTTRDLKKALKEMTADRKIKGLLLDLRNNPGGLLDQSVKVADVFLDKGVIVSTKGRLADQNMKFQAHGSGGAYHFNIIVLVNEGTASASEIVAGALKDNKRALILGAQTFGKGSVQTIIPMNDGAGLRLTTARYYTPSGTSIQATGVTPDIPVPSRLLIDNEKGGKTNAHKFLREKDLKHHFENEDNKADKLRNSDNNSAQDVLPEKGNADHKNGDKGKVVDREKEAQEKDFQLHTALLILKSLNIYENFSQKK